VARLRAIGLKHCETEPRKQLAVDETLRAIYLDCLANGAQMDWPLQDAKNRFSEVVQRARREGPQTVTLRGERAAVVLSAADYDALTRDRPSLVDDLLSGPAWDDEFAKAVDTRAKAPSRKAAL